MPPVNERSELALTRVSVWAGVTGVSGKAGLTVRTAQHCAAPVPGGRGLWQLVVDGWTGIELALRMLTCLAAVAGAAVWGLG